MSTLASTQNNAPLDSTGVGRPLTTAVLLALAGTVLWFLYHRIHYFSDYAPSSYAEDYFWPRRWGLIPHLLGGGTAISVGLVQLWLGATRRTGILHRRLGRVYVAAITIAAPTGMYLALTIPTAYDHLAYSSGLFMLDAAWIATTAMAVVAIRRRDISQHRAWMIRSYTVTFAFATYRLAEMWLAPYLPFPEDPVATQLGAMLAWGCWAVPLLCAEIGIGIAAMHKRPA